MDQPSAKFLAVNFDLAGLSLMGVGMPNCMPARMQRQIVLAVARLFH
jgi:hypothetical protein